MHQQRQEVEYRQRLYFRQRYLLLSAPHQEYPQRPLKRMNIAGERVLRQLRLQRRFYQRHRELQL